MIVCPGRPAVEEGMRESGEVDQIRLLPDEGIISVP